MLFTLQPKGCLPFGRKFRKFGMEGKMVRSLYFRKFQPKTESKTEEYVNRFVVVCSLRLVGPKSECCLPFTNFLIPDSRYTNSPLFWIQIVTDVAINSAANGFIAYHHPFHTQTRFFCQIVSTAFQTVFAFLEF